MINITEEQKKQISDYLVENLNKIWDRKAKKRDDWITWRRQRDAKSEFEHKDSPIMNACNVSVPLSAIIGQRMFAKLLANFSIRDPFWSIKALKDDPLERKKTDTLEKYFNILAKSSIDLNLRAVNKTILHETGTMGTCYVLVPWNKQVWNFKSKNNDGVIENKEVEIHNGPSIDPIPLEDVLYDESFQDLQRSPWMAYRVHKAWHEIELLESQGVYENVDVIKQWQETQPLEHQQDINDRRGLSNDQSSVWDLWACYIYWDLDNDGIVEDLKVTLHKETGTILHIDYNMLGIRPVEACIYLNRPFELEGTGTCEMCSDLQEEVDAHHRIRVDGSKLAAHRMMVVKRGSGIKGKEQIYQGKFIFCDDPRNDIIPLQTGEIYPSSIQAEQLDIQYAQMRSGMSDTMGGFADQTLRSRDTSVGQMLRLKEAQGIFSSIVEALEDSYSRIGMFIFFQLILNKDIVIQRERKFERMTKDELDILEDCLSMDINDLPYKINFSVRTTDIEQTFESKRQNYLTLAQLYATYLQRIFPVVGQISNPQLPQEMKSFLIKAFTGSSRLMEKIFEFFGEDSTEKYVPEYKKYEMLLELQQVMQGEMQNMQNLGQNMQGGANETRISRNQSFGNEQTTASGNAESNTGNVQLQGMGNVFQNF